MGATKSTPKKVRCSWVAPGDLLYQKYHDEEWGRPVYDDALLFEMLILEGMQAGLSWRLILERRPLIKKAFCNLEPVKLANLQDDELLAIMNKPGVIRNRLKTFGVRKNAQSFLELQKEKGSFSEYLWGFVNHVPILESKTVGQPTPCQSPLSEAISKDLKKRGFTFIGPTIAYAYIQAVGLINDHEANCFLNTYSEQAPSI